jgi:hypothetical protein
MGGARPGDERGAVADDGGVFDEDALREGLVGREFDHVQTQLPQQPDVGFVLPLGLVELDLAPGPQRQGDPAHHCMRVAEGRHVHRREDDTNAVTNGLPRRGAEFMMDNRTSCATTRSDDFGGNQERQRGRRWTWGNRKSVCPTVS